MVPGFALVGDPKNRPNNRQVDARSSGNTWHGLLSTALRRTVRLPLGKKPKRGQPSPCDMLHFRNVAVQLIHQLRRPAHQIDPCISQSSDGAKKRPPEGSPLIFSEFIPRILLTSSKLGPRYFLALLIFQAIDFNPSRKDISVRNFRRTKTYRDHLENMSV